MIFSARTPRLLPAAIILGLCRLSVALDYDLRGYVKEYPALMQPAAGDDEWLAVTRGRLKLRWFASESLTLVADYEAKLSFGSMLGEPAYVAIKSAQTAHRELLDLTGVIADRGNLFATHALDRAYAQWYSPRFVVTLGRQRIAWGVSNYFSPLDKFAPFAPSEIDKEERVGIDAAKVSLPWGTVSNVEAIYSPRKGWNDPRIGGRMRSSMGDWDISAIAGRFDGANVAGASTSGAIEGAGVTGEVLYTRGGLVRAGYPSPPCTTTVCPFGRWLGRPRQTGDFLRATVGAEYGFAWQNLTVGGEYYFDGSGTTDKYAYDWLGLAGGQRISVGMHYVAGSVRVLVTPLLTVVGATIANLNDGSRLIQPLAEYSVTASLLLKAGAQLFTGGAASEFGSASDMYYGIVAWYF